MRKSVARGLNVLLNNFQPWCSFKWADNQKLSPQFSQPLENHHIYSCHLLWERHSCIFILKALTSSFSLKTSLCCRSEVQVDLNAAEHKHFFVQSGFKQPLVFKAVCVPASWVTTTVKWFYKYRFQYSGTIHAVLLTIFNFNSTSRVCPTSLIRAVP